MYGYYDLPKEVSGKELVDILYKASSEMGFWFRNLNADLVHLYGLKSMRDDKESKSSARYRADKSYPEKRNPLVLDTTPTLAVNFFDIDLNARYSSVRFQAALGTRRLQEVDINQYSEFKPDYDAFLAKVKELF